MIEIYCVGCEKGVNVSGGMLGISKPDPTKDSDVYTDKKGKRHHSLKCDPIRFGVVNTELGKNSN